MKQFEFSLQRLLDVKLAREQLAEQQLAVALRKLEAERGELRVLHDRLAKQIQWVEKNHHGVARQYAVLAELRYMGQIQRLIELQSLQIASCEQVVSEEREALSEIMRERKGLERLCEREHQRWLLEHKRMEQKHTDEVASIMFARQQSELNGV